MNRAYKRGGSLWEGRFRSSLVQTERYVLGCYRYIEMNAVRANMVEHPIDYPWSSYAANAAGRKVELGIPAFGKRLNKRLTGARRRAVRAVGQRDEGRNSGFYPCQLI